MQQAVFTVDIGTSSLKAACISTEGLILSHARIRFPNTLRTAIHWLVALAQAWQHTTQGLLIQAICISGNGPTLVSVDSNDIPTAVYLWNASLPPVEQNKSLASTSLFIPRILGFKEFYSAEFFSATSLFSGPEYMIYALSGAKTTILSNPRFESAYWSASELTRLQISPDLLPPFVLHGTIAGTTRPQAPALLQLVPDLASIPANIPVITGGPDFAVALIGTGTIMPGTACDRAGTSEGLNACIQTKINAEGLRTLPSIIDPYWNISALLPNSGQLFHDWRKSTGQHNRAYPEIMQEIENTPILASKDGAEHEGRRLVESIGFSVRKAMDLLEEHISEKPTYVLSGGQARNKIWTQMKADITGRCFALTHTPDAELMGNAILAYTVLGEHTSIEQAVQTMVRIQTIYEPNIQNHALYTEKMSDL